MWVCLMLLAFFYSELKGFGLKASSLGFRANCLGFRDSVSELRI